MPEQQGTNADQLHPTELHDQVAHAHIAPEADVRGADDAGPTMFAGMGALETEVTPMTPPAAASDSDPDGSNDDETYDPRVEVTQGGA